MKQSDHSMKPLPQGMAALSPSCREASRLQSEALDHRLTLAQRIGLRIHLVLCKWCRRYGKQINFLHDCAPHLDDRDGQTPARLSDEAKERMRRRLQAEEK